MDISRIAAQDIVEEIGREIREHINLMDANGFIIASTDSNRIGQKHPGALRILSEGLDELSITRDMENEQMKMGINLPLIVYGETIGVVGITGIPEEVSRYGKIVKHMTEIMMADTIRKNSKRYGHRMYYRYLEEWIEASTIPVYENSFVQRGLHLGIDITKNYRMMALSFYTYQELSSSLEGQELIESMETSVRHAAERNGHIYLRTPPNLFLFVPECPDSQLIQFARQYSQMIHEKYNRTLVAGFDSAYGQHRNMKQSKQESLLALQSGLHLSREVSGYDSLGIHFLIQQLPTEAKQEYIRHFSARIPSGRMEECLQLINAYFQYNGSIQKMSEALFLHKNTLQYKLKKMEEYTGLDIRDVSSCGAYFVFLTIYQELLQC